MAINTTSISWPAYFRIFKNTRYRGKQKILIDNNEYIYCDVKEHYENDYVSLHVEFETSEDMLMFKLKYQL
jgi:hypothetical protein